MKKGELRRKSSQARKNYRKSKVNIHQFIAKENVSGNKSRKQRSDL
jgi:hypothetical protein